MVSVLPSTGRGSLTAETWENLDGLWVAVESSLRDARSGCLLVRLSRQISGPWMPIVSVYCSS